MVKKKEKKALLIKFIKANDLEFTDGRRNSDSVILAGYALHIEYTDASLIVEAIEEACTPDYGFEDEFYQVYEFARFNNYAVYWNSAAAQSKYIF